jgi:vacuolar-type H+-ATPase subunit F/Vma7
VISERTLLILAPPALVVGFKLGGARAETVTDAQSLNKAIEAAVETGESGIIAVPENMRKMVSEKNISAVRKTVFPVLAFYPTLSEWDV